MIARSRLQRLQRYATASGADAAAVDVPGATVIIVTSSGEILADTVIVAATGRARRRGLLDSSELAANEGLLLSPGSSVHTFGMRFCIDVLFLDKHMRVLKCVPQLQPWRIAFAPMGTRYVLELAGGRAAMANIPLGTRLLWFEREGECS